jgi:hypothetical protein
MALLDRLAQRTDLRAALVAAIAGHARERMRSWPVMSHRHLGAAILAVRPNALYEITDRLLDEAMSDCADLIDRDHQFPLDSSTISILAGRLVLLVERRAQQARSPLIRSAFDAMWPRVKGQVVNELVNGGFLDFIRREFAHAMEAR